MQEICQLRCALVERVNDEDRAVQDWILENVREQLRLNDPIVRVLKQ
jgi:hypothetical protein